MCPRGFFESASDAASCTRCPANQYCPGGDKVENPTSRGSNATCGDNLVTRNTGARSQSDCLAPAGYARTSPTTATPCATSEYAPQFNRLSKCLRCQSGLEENPALSLTVSDRATKKTVCSECACLPACLPASCLDRIGTFAPGGCNLRSTGRTSCLEQALHCTHSPMPDSSSCVVQSRSVKCRAKHSPAAAASCCCLVLPSRRNPSRQVHEPGSRAHVPPGLLP